jgi:hypothetical protein
MDRRAFLGALGSGLLAGPLAVGAEQAGRVPTIGVLGTTGLFHMFEESLPELGWIEGTTVKFERRSSSKALGLTIPTSLLLRADEVLQ